MFLFQCVALVVSYSACHNVVGASQKSVNECRGHEAILVGKSQPEEIVFTSMGKGKPLKGFDYGMKASLDNPDF